MNKHIAPALFCLLAACAQPTEVDDRPPAEEPSVSGIALSIEQAERMIDRGQDAARAKAELEQALGAKDITPDERRRALLALSRAHETLGEREKAIAIVEDEIAANKDRRDWPGDAFYKRLKQLVFEGGEAPKIAWQNAAPVAPFAEVVASYFPKNADGKVFAKLLIVGSDASVSEELGTFNISGALREQQRRECPLCDVDVSVSESVGRSNWMMIPARRDELGEALTAYYFDLHDNRIPSRYEAHLPMKVDDILRELEAGKSFVVAKERPGSPPALLLAAPRRVMLADVEAKLASLDELPTEPVYVDVPSKLRPKEIQGVIRAQWIPEVRRCYEDLLERDPKASAGIKAHFTVDGEGAPEGITLELDEGSLGDDDLACMQRGLEKVRFPATGETVTVGYPVKMTPQ